MKITAKIAGLVALSTSVSALVLIATIYFQARNVLIDRAAENQLAVVRAGVAEIDRFLYERYFDVQILAEDEHFEVYLEGLESTDAVLVQEELRESAELSNAWDVFSLVDLEGNILQSSRPDLIGVSFIQDDVEGVLARTLHSGQVEYSNIFNSAITDRRAILLVAPVLSEDNSREVVGLLVGHMSISPLREITETLIVGRAYIYDDRGDILVGSNKSLDVDSADLLFSSQNLVGHKELVLDEGDFFVGASSDGLFESLNVAAKQSGFLDYGGHHWTLVTETPTSTIFDDIDRATFLIAITVLPVSLFAALSIMAFYYFIIVRPLQAFQEPVEALTRGKFSRRVRVFSKDEIGRLAFSFNLMMAELKDLYDNLEIKVRKRTRKLQESQQKIVGLNDTLRVLNKILRHDILNDLLVIQSGVELYEKQQDNEGLKLAKIALGRSTKTIHNMRGLEHGISSGGPLLAVAVHKALEEVAAEFADMVIEIEGAAYVMADEALSSVFENIFHNAQIHGYSKHVFVTIMPQREVVEIRLANDGQNIPDDVKKKLFVEGGKFGKTGHTGMGLFIVKKTIERYGGTVQVIDNKPKGVVFVLTIPAASTS